MKIIRTILRNIKRKRFFKNEIPTISKYMKPGEYYFNYSSFYIYEKNSKDKIEQLFGFDLYHKHSFKRLFLSIISAGKINIDKPSYSKYLSEIVLITYKNKSLKMFDFTNGVVITKYYNQAEYNKYIENYSYFKKYFSTPKLIEKDDLDKVIIEKLIQNTKVNSVKIKDKLINDILERYTYYVNENIENITYGLDNVPKIKCLGDLISRNILYQNYNFYYIDFELSSEKFILYDFLNFIFFAYITNNDLFYIENFNKGYYDKKIINIFKNTNYKYNPNDKEKYFIIFLEEKISMEKKFKNKKHIRVLKAKFKDIQKKYYL